MQEEGGEKADMTIVKNVNDVTSTFTATKDGVVTITAKTNQIYVMQVTVTVPTASVE